MRTSSLAAIPLAIGAFAVGTGNIPIGTALGRPHQAVPSDPNSLTKRNEVRSRYYRMTVDLLIDKKEPFQLDFVFGCQVSVRTYKDDDRSVAMARGPALYARPTAEGHAVGVAAPEKTCSTGATSDVAWNRAHGVTFDVPADFLPAVVWYDDADDLSLGLLHASDQAYSRPGARLTLKHAAIHPSTKDDFEAFNKNGPRNLVSPESQKFTHSVSKENNLEHLSYGNQAWRFSIPLTCYGLSRVRLPDDMKKTVAEAMNDKGRYWALKSNDKSSSSLSSAIKADRGDYFSSRNYNGRSLDQYDIERSGLVRRDGTGAISSAIAKSEDGTRRYSAPEYYPLSKGTDFPFVNSNSTYPFRFNYSVSDDKSGILYCTQAANVEQILDIQNTKPGFYEDKFTINDEPIDNRTSGPNNQTIVDKNGYIIRAVRYFL